MSHHACYALSVHHLDIVVVEDSKPMQMILRSMLAGLQARRIRLFDNGPDALQAMAREPPNLLVTDLRMPGMSGLSLLRTIRAPEMAPLCFVPAIVVTAHATHGVVEEAMTAGAHLVLAKPVAPAAMLERIAWITNDARRFVLGPDGWFMIEGVRETLEARRRRAKAMNLARVAETRAKAQARGNELILPAATIEPSAPVRAAARPPDGRAKR